MEKLGRQKGKWMHLQHKHYITYNYNVVVITEAIDYNCSYKW